MHLKCQHTFNHSLKCHHGAESEEKFLTDLNLVLSSLEYNSN